MSDANKLIEGWDGESEDNCATSKFAEPELRLTANSNSTDQRLVDIVRILARRAVRNYFEKQNQKRDKVRP